MINNDIEQLEKLSKIKVVEIKDNEDGSAKIVFDIEESFISSYKQLYHLADWDQKHFENTVIKALKNSLEKDSRRNEQDPEFLWAKPKDGNE